MIRSLFAFVAVALTLLSLPSLAHHAISEVYDEGRTIAIEGEIESFLFVDPHTMLHVRVTEPDGVTRTWAVEWRAAARLELQGLTAKVLHPGELVMVCGNPGRDPAAYRMYLLDFEPLSPGRSPRPGADPAVCRHSI